MTRAFRAYEPDDVTEHDEDEYSVEPQDHMNVLWGRVVVLCIALLLAFSFGRVTVAAGPEEDVGRLREQLAAAQQKADELQAEIDARDALAAATAEELAPGGDDAAASDASPPAAPAQPASYTVKKGDTLRQIAQRVCGDISLAGAIAQQNGVRDATSLDVGQTLRLPSGCNA